MNITFINFNAEISGEGSRVLAAILRRQGHHVKMIFTPNIGSHPIEISDEDWQSTFGKTETYLFSFMSPYLRWAIHVTEFIKRVQPEARIIWGGVHPSAMPEDSMNYVDYLGRMECEEALPDFIARLENGDDVSTVSNFWVRKTDGSIVRNPLRPAITNLDSIPPPEYKLDDEFVLHEGRLHPMSPELLAHYHTEYYFGRPTYLALTTRGCPYMCTYCYNSQLVKAYNSRKIRYRNLIKVIHEEIKPAIEQFDFFRTVGLSDDDFFHIDKDTLRRFCDEWKREVNLPFAAACRPASCDPEKLDMLVDAGLKIVQIGVQSGSERLNREIYKRPSNNEKILEAMSHLSRYSDDGTIRVNADFIMDNPYETDGDVRESIKLLRRFPPSIDLNLFSLAFYPGTSIYDTCRQEGVISDSYDTFSKAFNFHVAQSHKYMTWLFLRETTMKPPTPKWLINLLMSRPVTLLGNLAPAFIRDGVIGRRIQRKATS